MRLFRVGASIDHLHDSCTEIAGVSESVHRIRAPSTNNIQTNNRTIINYILINK